MSSARQWEDLVHRPTRPQRSVWRAQTELLVLRHQVPVLERQVKVVDLRLADRLVLAAMTHRLPRPS